MIQCTILNHPLQLHSSDYDSGRNALYLCKLKYASLRILLISFERLQIFVRDQYVTGPFVSCLFILLRCAMGLTHMTENNVGQFME